MPRLDFWSHLSILAAYLAIWINPLQMSNSLGGRYVVCVRACAVR